jgi:hypothetical protein
MQDNKEDMYEAQDTLNAEVGSFEMIPHWILFHERATPNAIRLYLVLRSFAMGKGSAFPSRRRLSDSMQTSIPTVDQARRVLASIGAIRVSERRHPNGDQSSNLYLVAWNEETFFTGSKENSTTPSKESLLPLERKLGTEANQFNTNEIEPYGRTLVQKPIHPDLGFLEFWAIYPRRSGKGHARAAWEKAVRKETARDIIAGAARYRDDPNREKEFTAMPATWLNGERWGDEPLPAKATRSSQKLTEVEALIERAKQRDLMGDTRKEIG